jgi:hypothetical protein
VEKKSKIFNFSTNSLEIPLTEKLETTIKSELNLEKLLQILIKYIYNSGDFSSIIDQISDKNCFEILSLANSIGMEEFSDSLADFIGENFLTKENCLKIYNDVLNV